MRYSAKSAASNPFRTETRTFHAGFKCQILSLEVVCRRSRDFIGFRDHSFSPLFGGPFVSMLFFIVHRLGDSRKSAREVAASRLFCFTAGFSGFPNGIRFQAGWRRLLPVHNPTDTSTPLQLQMATT